MKRIILILLALVLITSCSTVKRPYLIGTDDNDTEVYLQRGNYTLQQEKFDDDITVTVEGLDVGAKDVSGVYVGIENRGTDIYSFTDSSIEIFGGNRETGEWTSIGIWDANAYYDKVVKKEQRTRALAILTLVFDIFTSTSSDSKSRSSLGVVSAGLQTATAVSAGDTISSSYFTSSSQLEKIMLYSSAVRENNTYSGLVVFNGRGDKNKAYPDYKIAFTKSEEEKHEFVLQRSDRESVINPWIDKAYSRFSFMPTYDVMNNAFGLTTVLNQPSGISLYSGLAVCSDGLSLPLGVTIKAFPNTWLMVGGNILLTGITEIAPQFGVNVITNRISAFVLAEYAFDHKRFGLTFGLGYAFIGN